MIIAARTGVVSTRSVEGDNAYEEVFRCSQYRHSVADCRVVFVPVGVRMIKDDLIFDDVPDGKIYPPDAPLDEILKETGAKSILRLVMHEEEADASNK